MASKKYLLLTAILVVLFQTISLAQTTTTDWGWNWKDSSKVATKNIPQYNEFLNNQYPYPAKPRDQWELGFGVGPSFISGGDIVPSVGFLGTVSARKAFNHTFSARLSYSGSFNSGTPNSYTRSLGAFDYKTQSHILGLDVIASLNPASYYRGNPKTNIYVLFGYNLMASYVQVKDASGSYHVFYGVGYPNSQSGLIGTVGGTKNNGRNDWAILSGADLGAGISFKLSNKINLGLEEKVIFTTYDLLDGYRPAAANTRNDMLHSTTVRLNINLGNPAKRVEPLWWLNPNNFAYSELNSPKHMKMPKVVLPDADGDGVTDQFDLEPNTPAGAPVDSHGVSKDTDGDGVPDYRDKELLTPQKCFPVNNDGVGTCPEPACCKELRDQIANMQLAPKTECAITDLPSIQFKGGTKLSKDAQKLLNAAAEKIKANPNCKVKVIGHPTASKAAQQLSYDRVEAVIKYLVEKQGIAESRFIFNYDGGNGDASTIDLQGTTEDGPNTVPAPHPNLKKKG